MNKFTLKNYPPILLIALVCIIAALSFGLQMVWKNHIEHKQAGLLAQMVTILTSYGTVISILTFINKSIKWKWIFRVIGVYKVSGKYVGKIISSYRIGDDTNKEFIQRYCKITIYQNLNGLLIEGDYFSDNKYKNISSSFKSFHEEIEKLENGSFQITYFYSNKGNQLHQDNLKYLLNNHEGISVLTFNPSNHNIQGYYFNHERSSHGTLSLQPE